MDRFHQDDIQIRGERWFEILNVYIEIFYFLRIGHRKYTCTPPRIRRNLGRHFNDKVTKEDLCVVDCVQGSYLGAKNGHKYISASVKP